MYTILWEYRVAPQAQGEFERVYGQAGDWVQFFRGGRGYFETTLLRDPEVPGRYMTIDKWESRKAYDEFRSECAVEYSAIDQRCEDLTLHETHLGSFDMVAEVPSN